MTWNSQRQSERYLQRLVEKGGAVSRLESGEVVGRMVAKEAVHPKPKSPWQFKVNNDTGCWEWQRGMTRGYGALVRFGEVRAARAYYKVLRGDIPQSLELDHLCNNPPCVNPGHLEPVTHKENLRRGASPSARNSRKTHCIHGHSFSGDNLYLWEATKGIFHRSCRTCAKLYQRRLRKRKKLANGSL